MSSENRTLLIVDDDEAFRQRLVRAMRDRAYDAVGAGTRAAALEAAQRRPPALAVVDLRLPGGSGLDVVRDLKALNASVRIVVLTGYGSIATAVESIKLGAESYLTKPADADQLVAALHGAPARQTDAVPSVPSLARVEREHIERVLADCGGNISQAARTLCLHRRSLQRKLSKHPTPR